MRNDDSGAGRTWTAAEVASALAPARGWKRSGTQYVTRCPAHDDHEPSLTLTDTGNPRRPVVFDCKAGCTPKEVFAALVRHGIEIGNPLRRKGWDRSGTAPRRPVPLAAPKVADRYAPWQGPIPREPTETELARLRWNGGEVTGTWYWTDRDGRPAFRTVRIETVQDGLRTKQVKPLSPWRDLERDRFTWRGAAPPQP